MMRTTKGHPTDKYSISGLRVPRRQTFALALTAALVATPVTMLPLASPAVAQTADSMAPEGESRPKKRRTNQKTRRKARQKPAAGGQVDGSDASEMGADSQNDDTEAEPSRRSGTRVKRPETKRSETKRPGKNPTGGETDPAFPHWAQPGLSLYLQPIFAYSHATTTSDGLTTRTTAAETGLRAGIADITIVAAEGGSPGFDIGTYAGFAFGDVATTTTREGLALKDTTETRYTRLLGGLTGTGYYGALRQRLDLSRAKISYDDAAKTVIQEIRAEHDLGLLLRAWLSAHHTWTYERAFYDASARPLLVSQDHWIHTRIFTNILEFSFDVGPGTTFVQEFANARAAETEPHQKFAEGRTDYVKAMTRCHIFWKLGASGSAQYVFNSTERRLGSLAAIRLPSDDLDQPSSAARPEDSVTASLFLGLSDIFYGVGFGYRYNVEILNLSEKAGAKKSVRRDSGFGLAFAAGL